MRYNATPSDYDDDHVTSQHPGKIVNTNLLHQEPEFLKGTGEIADFETEVMDTYLHKDCMEPKDFEIINEQIWKFLSSRYGFDTTIKRYYISKNSGFWSTNELECRLALIPVVIMRATDLYANKAAEKFVVQ